MYDEDDAGTPTESVQAVPPELLISYFGTLEEALAQINSCWPHLHPIQVHHLFSQDIWKRVVKYFQINNGNRSRDLLPKWSDLCLGRRIATLAELDSLPGILS